MNSLGFFLVFAGIAYKAQAQFAQCQCASLDQCVSNSQLQSQLQLSSCRDSCQAQLATTNPQGVLNCYAQSDQRRLQLSQQLKSCVESQVGRPCVGAGGVVPVIGTTARNVTAFQTNNGVRNNYVTYPQSNFNNFNINRRGKRHGGFYGFLGSRNMPAAIQTFDSCVRNCIRSAPAVTSFANTGANRGQTSYRGKRGGGSKGASYSSCARTLGCTLVSTGVNSAAATQNCKTQLGTSSSTEFSTFCNCLLSAGVSGVNCNVNTVNSNGFYTNARTTAFFDDEDPFFRLFDS